MVIQRTTTEIQKSKHSYLSKVLLRLENKLSEVNNLFLYSGSIFCILLALRLVVQQQFIYLW